MTIEIKAGFYFFCACGARGPGYLTERAAALAAERHAEECLAAKENGR